MGEMGKGCIYLMHLYPNPTYRCCTSLQGESVTNNTVVFCDFLKVIEQKYIISVTGHNNCLFVKDLPVCRWTRPLAVQQAAASKKNYPLHLRRYLVLIDPQHRAQILNIFASMSPQTRSTSSSWLEMVLDLTTTSSK